MLNLKLGDEFLGQQMPGTAIELRCCDNKGAAQRGADYILGITYPTADVQTALRQVSTGRAKRPIVLMGDRVRDKSHIMAVAHHAVQSPDQVEAWAHDWGTRASIPALADLPNAFSDNNHIGIVGMLFIPTRRLKFNSRSTRRSFSTCKWEWAM